jgi:DNA-binding GntR family transcriptional regulator
MASTGIDLRINREMLSLRFHFVEQLRLAIAGGRFKPGERLVERELCSLLNVSRSVVREGLRQLEAEGLIVTVPHRGPVVRSVTESDVEQIYSLRSLLEGHAARQFAEHATSDELRRLRDALAEIERTVKLMSPPEYIAAKEGFYVVLLGCPANAMLRQVLQPLYNRIIGLRAMSVGTMGRSAEAYAEMAEIVAAIERRDPEAAEKTCARHVRRAGESLLHKMRTSGGSAVAVGQSS